MATARSPPPVPGPEVLDRALAGAGSAPTAGSRPDSPGVHRDTPRGSEARDRYPASKARASAEHAQDPDLDDHTRAETAFFDRAQDEFEAWGRRAAR